MKKISIYILLLLSISCKKTEKTYYDNGKPKYINIWEDDFLKVNRYDREGNLLFKGKYKDLQLIDTVFVFNKKDKYFETIVP